MYKFILCLLILSGCAAEVKENTPATEPVEGRTYKPFLGKYSQNQSNLFRSFNFKVNNICEVEVVPGHFESVAFEMDGDKIKVHAAVNDDQEFTIKDDKTLIGEGGKNDLYIKEE